MAQTATVSTAIVDSTVVGRDLITAADAAAAQATIGVSPLDLGGDYTWTGDHTFDGSITFTSTFDAVDGDFTGTVTANAFVGDGSGLTGLAAFDQDLNTTDSVSFVAVSGDGSGLTNLPAAGNPFDQDLNTTDAAIFDGGSYTGDLDVGKITGAAGATTCSSIYMNPSAAFTYLRGAANTNVIRISSNDVLVFKTMYPQFATLDFGRANARWQTVYAQNLDAAGDVVMAANVDFTGLPTSDPVVAGRMWNDSGTPKISAG